MKFVLPILSFLMLAACQQPPEPSDVGRYQVLIIAEGTMRVDTKTGKTELMVGTDTPPSGVYAERNGRAQVWAEVKSATLY